MKTEKRDDDLIFGAANIADWIGVERHTIYYWHRKKMMPISRVGKTLVASKRKLERTIDKLTT